MDASMKINLQRYFSDSAYRQFCVEFYDIFKHNFNILDCLNNLPHFYEMLHAFVIAESTIKKLGSRARVEVDSSSRAFTSSRSSRTINDFTSSINFVAFSDIIIYLQKLLKNLKFVMLSVFRQSHLMPLPIL